MVPRPALIAAAALAAVVSGCSSAGTAASAPNLQALAHGQAITKLSAGTVESLPTGAVYLRFIRFAQPAGYAITSKQHVPGFVYVDSGVHRLVLAGQSPLDLAAGEATFHQSVTHQHLNGGPDQCVWYAIAAWPSSARGTSLVDPIARVPFESQDFDRATLPPVAYSEVLRKVTLATGGRTEAATFGGLSAFYVLSGKLTIRSAGHPAVTLDTENGAAFLPDTPLQESTSGDGNAVFLELLVTPSGKGFEVPLAQPPAA